MHYAFGFYAGFDIFHENGIKYLLADLLAECEPKRLHTFCRKYLQGHGAQMCGG